MSKDERRNFILNGALRVKHDCFAYDKYLRKCKALNSLYCMHGECNFYKTEEQRCKGCKEANGKLTCTECVKQGLK